MRRTFRRAKPKFVKPRFNINQYIRAQEVRLIDEDGSNIGVMSTAEALRKAREQELDLIEVNPKADPPVARITDYGSFKYQQEKQLKKQKAKQKKTDIKGIRLSLNISQHDKGIRLERAKEFLNDGDKVQLEMILKGRERQHTDLAKEILINFVKNLEEIASIEQHLKIQGKRLTIVLTPKK